ncbi:SanA/YdcF family protein [Ostreibacterium oceani]|uniref:Vancomycin high temperature exclusion protein n=1 Tax=Ostreibacterium oceani TaxID=2654998 RepID=A0A6N7EWZ0_9GAMM|nr:ElyC/SanA/YdcF family protein [Ostreibacterium oceani]MPV86060.1 vancomycin high temperature exclusion protein [Ostreibacterium oceani]
MQCKVTHLRQWVQRWLLRFIILVLVIAIVAALLDYRVTVSAKPEQYDRVQDIPHHSVGLLLGTSKYLTSGRVNAYYQHRINATVALYQAQKIDYVLVSGDNGTVYYNEPVSIQQDLIAAGIPASNIYLDYAGFRTLDSVVRSQKVFGQQQLTIISQPFHSARALYIAEHNGIDAIAFNAKDVPLKYGFKVQVRERLARMKMFWDLWTGQSPKFLGEPIEIPAS